MGFTQTQMKGEPISTSMFYMWRCVIAVSHADGLVQQEERDYLDNIFANMDRRGMLTPEQKAAFAADLGTAQNISDLIRYINDPACRGQLIYFAGILAHADGVVTPDEEAILKKLRADQMASLDMEKIRGDVRQGTALEMIAHDAKMQGLYGKSWYLRLIDRILEALGLPTLPDNNTDAK